MTKAIIGAVLTLTQLVGCATQANFTSTTGASTQQLARDRAECRLITRKNFQTNSVVSVGLLADIANIKQQNAAADYYNDCMTAKGYSAT